MKIVIVQRILHHYRLHFLIKLSVCIKECGGELSFFYSELNGVSKGEIPDFAVHLETYADVPINAAGLSDRMILQKGLLRKLRRAKPDIVIAEDIVGLPSTLIIAIYRLVWRRCYVIWTLGPHVVGKGRSRLRIVMAPAIWLIRNLAAGYISYSDWGKRNLQETYKKPIFTAYNSIETVRQSALDWERNLDKYENAETIELLFVGRLSFHKRVDLLISALPLLNKKSWKLHIVGDGEAKDSLVSLTERLGIRDKVVFHGLVVNNEKKAEIFKTSHLGVMPSLGGLFVQEAYAHGVPVMAGPADGTEFDLIRDVNPSLFIETITPQTLAEGLNKFLELSAMEKAHIAHRAAKVVAETYNIDNMATGFMAAIHHFSEPDKRS